MLKPFFILLVAICFAVTGELLLKAGMNQVGVLSFSNLGTGLVRCFTNPRILGGFTSIFISSLFWLAVLSRVNLSWAYPMLSLGYLLVLGFSAAFLHEHVSLTRWIGALVVCFGVYLIFRS